MRPEHLDYFQALFEGRADVSWNAWFARNEEQLRQELPRPAFLRLKFQQLDEAERYLRGAGRPFTPDAAAVRRERFHASLHPSVLDDRGRPLDSFRRKAYDGAFGLMMDGKREEARAILMDYIRRVRRRPPLKRAEALEEMCFDGERELALGDRSIGRALLEAVASVPGGNDLTDAATDRARELLAATPHDEI